MRVGNGGDTRRPARSRGRYLIVGASSRSSLSRSASSSRLSTRSE